MGNTYYLLGDNLALKNECTREITELIKDFAKNLKKLEKKYPTLGIGDTQTDEGIVEEIYNEIHWRS